MAAKYRQIDALVREGLAKPAEERAEWASALPPELAGKVLGIVEAPGWYDASPKPPVPPRAPREAEVPTLRGRPLAFALLAASALLGGVIAGVAAEAASYFLVGVIVAVAAFAAAAASQRRRSGSWSAAFGIAAAAGPERQRENYLGLQVLIFLGAMSLILVLALSTLFLLARVLREAEGRTVLGEDSMPAALVRLACVGLLAALMWLARGRGATAVAGTSRALRGFLVDRLPPVWVSWLYAEKSDPPKIAEEPPPAWKVALRNLPLVGIAIICALYAGRSEMAEQFLKAGSKFDEGRKLHLLFLVCRWVVRQPYTTLLLSMVAGPASLGVYASRVAAAAGVARSRPVAMAVVALCLAVFVALGVTSWG